MPATTAITTSAAVTRQKARRCCSILIAPQEGGRTSTQTKRTEKEICKVGAKDEADEDGRKTKQQRRMEVQAEGST